MICDIYMRCDAYDESIRTNDNIELTESMVFNKKKKSIRSTGEEEDDDDDDDDDGRISAKVILCVFFSFS